MKLYHSVNATVSESLDDEKDMSDADAGIPSSVDKSCEGTACCGGAHNSRPSDQSLLSDEKRGQFELKVDQERRLS